MASFVLRCLLAVVVLSGLSPLRSAAETASEDVCRSFLGIQQESAPERGRQVDPLTVFLGVTVACAEKRVEYGQAVTADPAKLQRNWEKLLQKNWSMAYCKRGTMFRDAIQQGWTISSLVTTKDGRAFRVTAECHDATA